MQNIFFTHNLKIRPLFLEMPPADFAIPIPFQSVTRMAHKYFFLLVRVIQNIELKGGSVMFKRKAQFGREKFLVSGQLLPSSIDLFILENSVK